MYYGLFGTGLVYELAAVVSVRARLQAFPPADKRLERPRALGDFAAESLTIRVKTALVRAKLPRLTLVVVTARGATLIW